MRQIGRSTVSARQLLGFGLNDNLSVFHFLPGGTGNQENSKCDAGKGATETSHYCNLTLHDGYDVSYAAMPHCRLGDVKRVSNDAPQPCETYQIAPALPGT